MNKAAWTTIAILTLIIGILLVVIGVLIYHTSSRQGNVRSSSAKNSSILGSNPTPSEDGFFINDGNQLVKLSEIENETYLDFNMIASTNDSSPTFSVRGEDLPIGKLKLKAYYAGIGVDLSFGNAGATINSIYDNSPAQLAGLQPGEVITTVDGEPVKAPISYVLGKNDLIGRMNDKVVLEILSGTSSRQVELPRTFRNTVSPDLYLLQGNPLFTIEPVEDYVIIKVDKALEPGLYRFEFSEQENIVVGGYIGIGPTPLPTPTPVPMPSQKWLFQIE
jgi:hypothetical protein